MRMGPMQGVQPKAKAKPSKKPLHRWAVPQNCGGHVAVEPAGQGGTKKPMTESEKK